MPPKNETGNSPAAAPTGEPRLTHSVLTPPTGDLTHFTLLEAHADDTGVIVHYESLPGNLPHTYGNSVSLWTSTIPNIPGGLLASATISTDDQVGDVHIRHGLGANYYSVTYQTGPDTTMCALAEVKLAKQRTVAPPTFVEMGIQNVSGAGIQILYNTLPGYLPNSYKNWIGLWQGFALPYNPTSPLARQSVPTDASQGSVKIPYAFGLYDYTLVYFAGPEPINAAAILYFKVTVA
jgi:hypothetical protein